MRKGANLQAQVHLGNGPGAVEQFEAGLPAAFEKVNPGTTLKVRKLSPVDEHGNAKLRIYVEGDQDPAADFSAFIMSALQKTIATMPGVTIGHAGETEGEEEESEVLLSPKAKAAAEALSAQNQPAQAAARAPQENPATTPPEAATQSPPKSAAEALSSPAEAPQVATPAPGEESGTRAEQAGEPFWKKLFGRG